LESESVPAKVEEPKPKQKKKGKIAQVYKLHQKGLGVKEISQKLSINERLVRSYLWRSANQKNTRNCSKDISQREKRRQRPSHT
jgi:DNA-binding NarL/FixJ family response regulator